MPEQQGERTADQAFTNSSAAPGAHAAGQEVGVRGTALKLAINVPCRITKPLIKLIETFNCWVKN